MNSNEVGTKHFGVQPDSGSLVELNPSLVVIVAT